MAKRQLITKEFLIHKLTRYVEKEGIVPKKREFGYTTPITKYFGSYNKFVSFCGYIPNKSGNRKLPKEFFVNKLNEFVKTHKNSPFRLIYAKGEGNYFRFGYLLLSNSITI